MTTHEIENLVSQRDDTLARIESFYKQIEEIQVKHKQEIDKLVEANRLNVETIESQWASKMNDLQVKFDESQALVKVLGGTEMGQKHLAEQRREHLRSVIDQHQAELKALEG